MQPVLGDDVVYLDEQTVVLRAEAVRRGARGIWSTSGVIP